MQLFVKMNVCTKALISANSMQVIYNNFTDENKTIKEEQNELLF